MSDSSIILRIEAIKENISTSLLASHDKYDNIVLDICIDLRFRRFLVVSMPQSGIRMKPDQQFSYMKTILV
jgi:hypothetical protein